MGQLVVGGESGPLGGLLDHAVLDHVGGGVEELGDEGVLVCNGNDTAARGPDSACSFIVEIELLGGLAVEVTEEEAGVADLLRGQGEEAVEVVDIGVESVDPDWVLFQGSTEGGA